MGLWFCQRFIIRPLQPLDGSGSGLVLGNPSSQPFQTYSYYIMPNGLVTSFIDNVPGRGDKFRIGGTEAPTVQIKICRK
ncbi:MAG: glycoside hydrolase family 68 protein [Candidatus Phlomobacter fragariae]